MKRKFQKIFLIVTMFALSSCNDFLDIVPTGRVIPQTVDEYRALMVKAYSNFPKDRGLATFRADEMLFNATSDYDLNNFKDIYIWKDDNPAISTFSFKWLDYYEVVFTCNHVILNKDIISNGTPQEINQLVSEAYLLRAYVYFTMANLYAPAYNKCNVNETLAVPLNLDNNTDAVLGRNTLQEVYNQIDKDIEKGLELVQIESHPLENLYRFSRISAMAFKMRVALYKEDWETVVDLGKQIIDKSDANLLDMRADNKTIVNSYNSPETLLALEQIISAGYLRAMYLDGNLSAMYDRNDYRLKNYYKAITPKISIIDKAGSNEFRCSFRIGEIYLNLSEALLQLNNLPQSKTYLLELLKNRLRTNLYQAEAAKVEGLSKPEFQEYLYQERFKELAFEGHRWFDLRRTTQKKIVHTLNGKQYVLEESDTRYTLQIPDEARNNNPNLN